MGFCKCIKLAKSGEKIIITNHGKIVAEIIPTKEKSMNSTLLEEYLKEENKTGKILLSSGKKQIEMNKKRKNIIGRKYQR